MTYAEHAVAFGTNGLAGSSEGNRTFSNNSINTSTLNGVIDMSANGLNDRTNSSGGRKNSSAHCKNGRGDWLAAKISEYSVEEICASTGMTPKAVQNVRRRKSKLSFDNFTELCLDRPEFAAAYAEFIGLLRPGEAEYAGAITQAFNAWQRRQK